MRHDIDELFAQLGKLQNLNVESLSSATEFLIDFDANAINAVRPVLGSRDGNITMTFSANEIVFHEDGNHIVLPDGEMLLWDTDGIPTRVYQLMDIQKTKVLALYAGPGAGKTTMSADVFARLKHAGYNVELVREYAKELVWEYGNIPPHITQSDIVAEQYRRQAILMGQVELIITDSPIILSTIYGSSMEEAKNYHDQFDNYEVLIERKKAYNPKGRYQDESQAKALDTLCQQFATRSFPGTELGGKWLFDYAVDIIKGRV